MILFVAFLFSVIVGLSNSEYSQDSCSNSNSSSDVSTVMNLLRILNYEERYKQHCSSLLTNYTPTDNHTITFLPHVSGISDRFVGMATTLVLAFATNRRFLLGNMPELIDMATAFDVSRNISRDDVSDVSIISALRENGMIGTGWHMFPTSDNKIAIVNAIGDDKYLLSKPFQDIAFNKHINVLYVSTNRGLTIRAFGVQAYKKNLNAMGLTPLTAFGCALGYMFAPKPDIFIPLLPVMQKMVSPESPNDISIAIHIRTDDNVLNHGQSIDMSAYTSYFDCARSVEKMVLQGKLGSVSRVKWYLFTDSVALRRQAAKKYRGKVVTSLDVPVEHTAKEKICPLESCVSQSGFSSAVAEWWLLGEADYIVASLYSGFGKSSAARAFHLHNTFFTFPGNKQDCLLSRNYFNNMRGLGRDLAGI